MPSAARRARTIVSAVALACTPAAVFAQQPVRPFQEVSSSAQLLRDSIVALAKGQLGRRYVRGGTSPQRGFDCSGLVKYVLMSLHLDVPRTARLQARVGEPIARDTSRLLPGDLLTFARQRAGVSHIAIYVGNGRMIHASSTAGRVIETSLIRPPAPRLKPWNGARRVVALNDSARAPSLLAER